MLFAFCPYVFSHTAHIQLLMVAGIPLCLLAFHRLVDAPSPARGVALGLALAAQAMSCAYYGVSAGLTVGYATLFYAWSRRLWTSRPFWIAIAIAAASSVGIVLPFFLPYLEIQEDTGFARSLDDARQWSAYVRSYLASGAHAHAWMLPIIRDWNGAVLFPGFLSIGLAVAGAAIALRRRAAAPTAAGAFSRDRETALFYGSIAILTFWASLGPRAGLYTRPPRHDSGLLVSARARAHGHRRDAVPRHLRRLRRPRAAAIGSPASHAIAAVACAAALVELNDIPFDWRPPIPFPPCTASSPDCRAGPVAEFPFYDRRIDFHIHTRYMLNSTAHWQPLVNGYSDHIPADFRTLAPILATFPSQESFDALSDRRVRYITLNRGRHGYGAGTWPDIERRLQPYLPHLRVVADDGEMVIYEVVSWPK